MAFIPHLLFQFSIPHQLLHLSLYMQQRLGAMMRDPIRSVSIREFDIMLYRPGFHTVKT